MTESARAGLGDGSSDWQEVDLLTYDEADPRVVQVIAEWRERVPALRAEGRDGEADALAARLAALEEMHGEIRQALEQPGRLRRAADTDTQR